MIARLLLRPPSTNSAKPLWYPFSESIHVTSEVPVRTYSWMVCLVPTPVTPPLMSPCRHQTAPVPPSSHCARPPRRCTIHLATWSKREGSKQASQIQIMDRASARQRLLDEQREAALVHSNPRDRLRLMPVNPHLLTVIG